MAALHNEPTPDRCRRGSYSMDSYRCPHFCCCSNTPYDPSPVSASGSPCMHSSCFDFCPHDLHANSIQNSLATANPEQTASVLSLMLYTFLDKTIYKAYNIPHLPLDQLPPLADYDSTKHLVARSFQVRFTRNILHDPPDPVYDTCSIWIPSLSLSGVISSSGLCRSSVSSDLLKDHSIGVTTHGIQSGVEYCILALMLVLRVSIEL